MSERPKKDSERRAPIIPSESHQQNEPISHLTQESLKQTYKEREMAMKQLTEEEHLKEEKVKNMREMIAKSKADERSTRRVNAGGIINESSKRLAKTEVSKAPKVPKQEPV